MDKYVFDFWTPPFEYYEGRHWTEYVDAVAKAANDIGCTFPLENILMKLPSITLPFVDTQRIIYTWMLP